MVYCDGSLVGELRLCCCGRGGGGHGSEKVAVVGAAARAGAAGGGWPRSRAPAATADHAAAADQADGARSRAGAAARWPGGRGGAETPGAIGARGGCCRREGYEGGA